MLRPAAPLLLLLACQPPPRSVPEDTPPVPAAPVSDVAWWCSCYARSGPVPVTSCRKDHADCRRIEALAREGGGSAMVPGSLTHRCREIRADHPGDVLGERARWQAVEKSGSWIFQGECRLPGPADAPPPPVPEDIHDDERLGGLALGMADAAVRDQLGAPPISSEPDPDATAPFTSTWLYPERGLKLEFAADQRTGPWQLISVRAEPPCDLRTSRGIGLGDPRSNVEAAYLKENPFPMRANATSFIAATPTRLLRLEFDPRTNTLSALHLQRNPERAQR